VALAPPVTLAPAWPPLEVVPLVVPPLAPVFPPLDAVDDPPVADWPADAEEEEEEEEESLFPPDALADDDPCEPAEPGAPAFPVAPQSSCSRPSWWILRIPRLRPFCRGRGARPSAGQQPQKPGGQGEPTEQLQVVRTRIGTRGGNMKSHAGSVAIPDGFGKAGSIELTNPSAVGQRRRRPRELSGWAWLPGKGRGSGGTRHAWS